MAHFNLHYFMNTLADRKGRDICVLQIGAMDGVTFDPMHDYIKRFDWGGLLVEPLEPYFSQLKATYADNPRITCVQTAIADKVGKVTFHWVPPEAIAPDKVPHTLGLGAASLYPDRNALAFDEVGPYVQTVEATATTLPALLQGHPLQSVDVVCIDAEGHDYQIMAQFPFETFHPWVIQCELVNMPKAEQNALKRLLDAQGYIHTKAGYNLLAVSLRFFEKFSY